MTGRRWLAIGAFLGFASVALGAFGAHGLKRASSEWDLTPQEQTQRLDNWEVAARYQMYHALALMCVGLIIDRQSRRLLHLAAGAFCLGVAVFSGCLYAYVLTGTKVWAMVVPVGGVFLLLGWLGVLAGVLLPPAGRGSD